MSLLNSARGAVSPQSLLLSDWDRRSEYGPKDSSASA